MPALQRSAACQEGEGRCAPRQRVSAQTGGPPGGCGAHTLDVAAVEGVVQRGPARGLAQGQRWVSGGRNAGGLAPRARRRPQRTRSLAETLAPRSMSRNSTSSAFPTTGRSGARGGGSDGESSPARALSRRRLARLRRNRGLLRTCMDQGGDSMLVAVIGRRTVAKVLLDQRDLVPPAGSEEVDLPERGGHRRDGVVHLWPSGLTVEECGTPTRPTLPAPTSLT